MVKKKWRKKAIAIILWPHKQAILSYLRQCNVTAEWGYFLRNWGVIMAGQEKISNTSRVPYKKFGPLAIKHIFGTPNIVTLFLTII